MTVTAAATFTVYIHSDSWLKLEDLEALCERARAEGFPSDSRLVGPEPGLDNCYYLAFKKAVAK